MSDPILQRDDHGLITVLTLNTPATINALSSRMLTLLSETLDDIAASTQRVVILQAAGKNFCAGHDLREVLALCGADDQGQAGLTTLFDLCSGVMQKITQLPQPVIAAVQGIATAAGCQLAASCDFVVAADSARFGVNGVNIGLFCSTPLVALSRKIAPAQAFDLAATGRFIAASDARTLGLVTHVAPLDDLTAHARDLADTLARKLPSALALGKRTAAAQSAPDLARAYELAGAAMVQNLMTPATREGITAFLEKREPNWA